MLLHYILSHLDDSKTEPVRNIIVFISASPARIKLVHHLWAFSIPQGSQYGKFIYGLLYINKYCIISYAGTTDIVWEQILSSISRLVEFNNICGHPVQLERHITPIILNGSSSAEYINLKELQTAIEWQNLLLHMDAFFSDKWESPGSYDLSVVHQQCAQYCTWLNEKMALKSLRSKVLDFANALVEILMCVKLTWGVWWIRWCLKSTEKQSNWNIARNKKSYHRSYTVWRYL